MLDDLTITYKVRPPLQVINHVREPFNYKGVMMWPSPNNGLIEKYTGQWKNLHITIIYDTLTIRNSWHKFYHGNNYGDYSYNEIVETIVDLLAKFGHSVVTAKIRKVSIGCNLPINAAEILEKAISQGNYKFLEMASFTTSSRCYGKYVKKNRTKLKCYDKQEEAKRHSGLIIPPTLRIEFEMNMSYVNKLKTIPLKLVTVEDLLSDNWIDLAKQTLIKQVDQIVFDHSIPLEPGDKIKDLIAKRYMNTSQSRKELKMVVSPKTFRSFVSTQKKILKSHSSQNLNLMLIQLIIQRFDYLKNNQNHQTNAAEKLQFG